MYHLSDLQHCFVSLSENTDTRSKSQDQIQQARSQLRIRRRKLTGPYRQGDLSDRAVTAVLRRPTEEKVKQLEDQSEVVENVSLRNSHNNFLWNEAIMYVLASKSQQNKSLPYQNIHSRCCTNVVVYKVTRVNIEGWFLVLEDRYRIIVRYDRPTTRRGWATFFI